MQLASISVHLELWSNGSMLLRYWDFSAAYLPVYYYVPLAHITLLFEVQQARMLTNPAEKDPELKQIKWCFRLTKWHHRIKYNYTRVRGKRAWFPASHPPRKTKQFY